MKILPKEEQAGLKYYHESTTREITAEHIAAFRKIVEEIFGGYQMTDGEITFFITRSLDSHVRLLKK